MHRDLSRQRAPTSSRDLSLYTTKEIDQIRRSNATLKHTKWQSCLLFFWNRDQKTVCYRTGTSWLFILIFYPIFVALVFGLFYMIMLLLIHCVKTYAADSPIVNKDSLTKQPSYS